jgi:hypothetical protein
MVNPNRPLAATTQARRGAQIGDATGSGPFGAGLSITVRFNRLPAYAEGLGRRARAATFKFLERVRESIRTKMRGPKRGRIYVRNGKVHQASAAGEAPAIVSGETYRSIQVRNIGLGGSAQISIGGAARFLKGTRRMAPRWMLEDEIKEQRPAFQREIAASVRFRED